MSYLISIDDSDNDCYYKRDVDSIPIAYVSKDQLGQESFSLHSFNDETYISATLYDEEELCGTDRNNYSSMASGLQYSIDFVECFTASFTFQGVTLGSGTVTSVKWLFPDGSSAVASPPGTTVYFTFDCDNLDDDIFIELTLSTGFTVVFNIGSIPWSFWSWNCEPCGNLGDGPFRLKSATNDFKLYPNPATNQIYYQSTFAEDELIDLEIFSVNGKMVFNGTTMPPNGKINIENLPSGVYIFRLRMNDSMEFRKFTIR